jgi:hypothetical protein
MKSNLCENGKIFEAKFSVQKRRHVAVRSIPQGVVHVSKFSGRSGEEGIPAGRLRKSPGWPLLRVTVRVSQRSMGYRAERTFRVYNELFIGPAGVTPRAETLQPRVPTSPLQPQPGNPTSAG